MLPHHDLMEWESAVSFICFLNAEEKTQQGARLQLHKARPKESLKAISTGTSATESWKHT